jgi:uncharacterized protein (TIGR00369 family)
MSTDERERFQALLDAHYPYGEVRIEEIGEGHAKLRKLIGPAHLRMGGTVAGPALMALADVAAFLALQAPGMHRVDAVTSQLTIHFLSRPSARDVVADARILRCGRIQAVAEVRICSDGDPQPVAHAMVTYALPRP